MYYFVVLSEVSVGGAMEEINNNKNKNNPPTQILSNCYVIHLNASSFVIIFSVFTFMWNFGSKITMPLYVSQHFSSFSSLRSFLSLHLHADGIFPVLPYTHHMYVDDYYDYLSSHELRGGLIENKFQWWCILFGLHQHLPKYIIKWNYYLRYFCVCFLLITLTG